jgi:DNA-binding PadR family transcriptional regulator
MNLHDTILGILSWKPAYGYDLKRIISDSEIFYWSGNNNQIYKSLLELQSEGLVTSEVQVQEKLPAKKTYSITERGREALRRSLLAEPDLPELRKDFLIQLAWSESLSDEEVLSLLETYEAEVAGRLRMYQAQAQASGTEKSPGRSPRERYLWQRIAENLAVTYQAELDWVQQTRKAVSAGKYQ